MVFRRDEVSDATEEMLELIGIRERCSRDLRDVWLAATRITEQKIENGELAGGAVSRP